MTGFSSSTTNGFNSPTSSISPTFSSYSSSSSNSSQSSEHKAATGQIKSELATDGDKSQLITTATLVFTTRSDPTRASCTPTTVKPAAPVHSPITLSPNDSPSLSSNAGLNAHLDSTLSSLISNLNESSLQSSLRSSGGGGGGGGGGSQLNGLLGANGGSTISSAVCKLLKSYTWTVVPKQQKAPPAPTKRKQHVKRPMNACE